MFARGSKRGRGRRRSDGLDGLVPISLGGDHPGIAQSGPRYQLVGVDHRDAVARKREAPIDTRGLVFAVPRIHRAAQNENDAKSRVDARVDASVEIRAVM